MINMMNIDGDVSHQQNHFPNGNSAENQNGKPGNEHSGDTVQNLQLCLETYKEKKILEYKDNGEEIYQVLVRFLLSPPRLL